MKDHEIREAINELRDVAIKYRDAEQLRIRIAGVVHSIVEKCKPKTSKDDLLLNIKEIANAEYEYPEYASDGLWEVQKLIEEFEELEIINKSISDIPDCNCFCENSMEKLLLKVELLKKVKENKYLADENTWWPMP